jgi:hypothetical protein
MRDMKSISPHLPSTINPDIHRHQLSSTGGQDGEVVTRELAGGLKDCLVAWSGNTRDIAIQSFTEFVRVGVRQPSMWSGLRNQVFLGDEALVRRAQVQSDRLYVNARSDPGYFFSSADT